MNESESIIKPKITLKIFLSFLILSIIVFLMVYLLVIKYLPYKISITNHSAAWRGTDCGKILFYDELGNGHDIANLGKSIKGPLYFVDDDTIIQEQNGCRLYPETIPTQFALKGEMVYPANVNISTSDNWILQGNSVLITATLSLSNTFTQYDNLPFLINSMSSSVRFQIDAPNFEYSPSNDEAQLVPLNLSTPARTEWILAPVERAQGNQYINIRVLGNQFPIQSTSKLDIRPIIGIDVRINAILTAAASSVVFILASLKTYLEIQNMRRGKVLPS